MRVTWGKNVTRINFYQEKKPMLLYTALISGIVALLLAWRVNQKNKDLQERIAQVNSRIYHLRHEIQESLQLAEQERLKLTFEILKLQGNLQLTGDMKISEIYAAHPQAQQVLAGFHVGGCSSCAVDDSQTLAEAIALSGRDLKPALVALNTLVANGNGQLTPDMLKTPNVQLQL
jgi:TolA-binding protein